MAKTCFSGLKVLSSQFTEESVIASNDPSAKPEAQHFFYIEF
jgi:hypothetical protein